MAFRTATDAPPAFGYVETVHDGERERENLETARRYLAAIEASTSPNGDAALSDASAYFAPDVVQEELPNRLVPSGARRDIAALREAAERGKGVLRSQRYEVRGAYAAGEMVILEVFWVGTLAVPVGSLPAGADMKAHFAVFLEFRDGLIHRQRNYDCFEPF